MNGAVKRSYSYENGILECGKDREERKKCQLFEREWVWKLIRGKREKERAEQASTGL